MANVASVIRETVTADGVTVGDMVAACVAAGLTEVTTEKVMASAQSEASRRKIGRHPSLSRVFIKLDGAVTLGLGDAVPTKQRRTVAAKAQRGENRGRHPHPEAFIANLVAEAKLVKTQNRDAGLTFRLTESASIQTLLSGFSDRGWDRPTWVRVTLVGEETHLSLGPVPKQGAA